MIQWNFMKLPRGEKLQQRAFELSGWSATAASACCLGTHSISIQQWPWVNWIVCLAECLTFRHIGWKHLETMYLFHLIWPIWPPLVRSSCFNCLIGVALGAPTAQLRGPPTSTWRLQPQKRGWLKWLVLAFRWILDQKICGFLRSKSKPVVYQQNCQCYCQKWGSQHHTWGVHYKDLK